MKFFNRGFHRFCEGTSCHGFQELITSKTCFWRVFWSVTVLGALVITVYQVVKTVIEFINQPTNTFMVSADEETIMYPPLRLCYWHWLHWVDFAKVKQLKLDRDALLFAFLFYTRIFSKDHFDIDAAEAKLVKYMNKKNISSVFNFHQSIARPLPIISNNNLSAYFDKTEVIYRHPGFLFCYTMSNEQIAQYLKDRQKNIDEPSSKKLIKFSLVNENYDYNFNNMSDFATSQEYSRFMVRWIRHKTLYAIDEKDIYKNLSAFAPPVLLFPNAFDEQNDVPMVTEIDEYSVTMKASSYQWKDSSQVNCAEGQRAVSGNETCKFVCEATVYKPNCSCVRMHYAIYMKKDTPDNVCRDEVIIQDSSGERIANSTARNKTVFTQICYRDKTIVDAFLKCMKNCDMPCELWSYSVSVLLTKMPELVRGTGRKHMTNVTIEYPNQDNIMVMVAVDAQSFETFIGSVGGLLGIWTGASIVSFIQFIYLCCCTDVERGECWTPSLLLQSARRQNSSTQNGVSRVEPPVEIPPGDVGVRLKSETTTLQ